MNKKGHVLNGFLLAVGVGVVLEPAGDLSTVVTVAEVLPPVVLGALFPDVDTAFGRHRKTLHNLPLLILAIVYPVYFGNLEFVWVGIATHYVLDMVGSKRGIALFYPWDREFGFPTGVATSSDWATVVTVLVTALEVAAFAGLVWYVLPALDVAALTRLFEGAQNTIWIAA
jgi:membrane-bound metal-dependent hydrolase YbcI (DUF457 family)